MLKLDFTCTKNTLCALNAVYLMVGMSLIVAAGYGKSFGIVSSLSIMSGAMAIGFFLIIVSISGIIGALRHNQILLFIYMVFLSLVFIIQFFVSCSCLALGREKQVRLLGMAWGMMGSSTRQSLEQRLDCCGLMDSVEEHEQFVMDVNLCNAACTRSGQCFRCGDLMLQHASDTLRFLGGVGLFCSFSQLVCVWLVMRYRNLRNDDVTTNPKL